MDFLNQLGEKLGTTMQTVRDADATKKARTVAAVPGLTLQVGKLEGQIKKSYQEIGEAYYLTHASDPNLEFEKQIMDIRQAKARIAELKAEIEKRKKYDPAAEREAKIVAEGQKDTTEASIQE